MRIKKIKDWKNWKDTPIKGIGRTNFPETIGRMFGKLLVDDLISITPLGPKNSPVLIQSREEFEKIFNQ